MSNMFKSASSLILNYSNNNNNQPALLNEQELEEFGDSSADSPASVQVASEPLHPTSHHSLSHRSPRLCPCPFGSTSHHTTSCQKKPIRLVGKKGDLNLRQLHIPQRSQHYLEDLFTTLIDCKWRYIFILLVCSLVISWLLFGILWYLIGYFHGDFEAANVKNESYERCVLEVFDFPTAFLFSLETQHTIGYGSRQVTSHCAEGIVLISIQSCFGVALQAFVTGLIFAKIARPKKRKNTIIYSKCAVICLRDGVLTLCVRVGDMRRTHIIGCFVRCLLIQERRTREGESWPMEPYNVHVQVNDCGDKMLMAWPMIVEHRITRDSPFWNYSADDFLTKKYELLYILEGVVDATGMSFEARRSYLPTEIKWGFHFESLITKQKHHGPFLLDYEKFHNCKEILSFPKCSASSMALESQEREEEEDREGNQLQMS